MCTCRHAIAVIFSFNASRTLMAWQGFSTRWYVGDVNSAWNDPDLRSALLQSLKRSVLVVVIAVPLGVGFALALDRWRGRGSGTGELPDAVLVHHARDRDRHGAPALLLEGGDRDRARVRVAGARRLDVHDGVPGHRGARADALDRSRVRGGGDGPRRLAEQAVGRALLPLLLPAIFASVAIVFAATIDNFVISQQLSSGAADQTIPMLIHSAARHGPLLP